MNGSLTAADVAAVTRNNDGYGDGMYGGWFWIVILLFAFWNRGNNDNCASSGMVANEFTQRDIFNTNTAVLTSANNTQRDILNGTCQTQRDVLENRYTTQLGLTNLGAKMQECCCETQKEILQNRYDNALQTQTLSAQMAQCCCDLRTEGVANTQKILDKLCENEVNQLRADLQSAQLQISQLSQTANITNTLRPFPQPAYITCSPYQSYGFNNCGCCGNNVII